MRRYWPAAVLGTFFALTSFLTLDRAVNARIPMRDAGRLATAFPSPLLKVTALEFEGVLSDLYFLDSLVFFGEKLDGPGPHGISDGEWQWLYQTLSTASDLDPHFEDAYYFGNSIFAWDGKMVVEANRLLEKGSRFRTWDWWLPFLLGFNRFYFLDDNAGGAEALMEAAARPGAPPTVASLATRLALKGRRTENAILFLEGILKRTEDEVVRKDYLLRLNALQRVLFLEQAVAAFRRQLGSSPDSLDQLISADLLTAIPDDPYGGTFFLSAEGEVKTTSQLRQRRTVSEKE